MFLNQWGDVLGFVVLEKLNLDVWGKTLPQQNEFSGYAFLSR
jgi:hypothetical protein